MNKPATRLSRSAMLLVALAGLFLFQQIVLLHVPIPNTLIWNGDETWLMQEYRTQMMTGQFRYPEALGSTLAIGNGIVFGSMWITASIYGLPAIVFSGLNHVDVGRGVSALIAVVLLFLVYREGRRLGASRRLIIGSIIVFVLTDGFTRASHSARYDIISSLGVLTVFSVLVRLHSQPSKLGDVAVGALLPSTLLISPHVLLCSVLAIVFAAGWRVRSAGRAVARRQSLGLFGAAGLMLLLYAATNPSDWTPLGPPSASTNALDASIGYLPMLRNFRLVSIIAEIGQRITTLRIVAPLFLLSLGVGVMIALAKFGAVRRALPPYSLGIAGLTLLSFFVLETDDARAVIYVLPILTIVLIAILNGVATWSENVALAIVIVPALIFTPIFVVRSLQGGALGERVVGDCKEGYRQVAQALDVVSGRTLIDNQGMGYLLQSSALHPMADIFAWHAATNDSIGAVLEKYRVQYVVRVRTYGRNGYAFYRENLDRYVDAHTTEVTRYVGNFSDYRVSYRTGHKDGLDTILVSEFR